MNVIDFPSADQALIIRAGAHAVDPEKLPEDARFRSGVTDLDMARLIRAIEKGLVVYLAGYKWSCQPERSPVSKGLSATVNEGIRTGLIAQVVIRTGMHTVQQRAVAAPVHLRSKADLDRPACHAPGGLKRYRLMNREDARYVDCLACRLVVLIPSLDTGIVEV